jgi:hypothetical protein
LGGFNKVELTIEDCKEIKLLGLNYRGTPQDEKMVETFRRIGGLVEEHAGTNLHTLYAIEPAGKLDTLQVFVGMEYKPDIASPEELEVKTIPCSKVLIAHIQSHKLVMPSPNSVKQKIEAFARDIGVATKGIYVDKIMEKDRVEVLAPLK